LQAIDNLGLEAPHVIHRFFAKATMKLFGQANTNHPTPRVLHQDKASDNRSNGQANDEAGQGRNGDGRHGDTPSIRNSTIMLDGH
jgi:hypothetical protein